MTEVSRDLAPRLSAKGLELPENLSYEQWREILVRTAKMQSASTWALAQVIFYGQGRYGRKYDEAIAATGIPYQTCANLAFVAGQYDFSRIREKLSFGHHAEVAHLADDEREAWLDRAQQHGWDSLQLREMRRREKLGTQGATIGKLYTMTVYATEAERDRWLIQADIAGIHVRDWICAAANFAIEQGFTPPIEAEAVEVEEA